MKLSPAMSLVATLLAAAMPASPAEHEVRQTIEIADSPDAVWEAVGDFGALHTWLPGIDACEIVEGEDDAVGAVRLLTLADGGRVRERLLAYDAASRSLSYSIVEAALPVENYRSTLTVHATEGGSRVEWHGTFESGPEMVPAFEGLYSGGLSNLKRMIEAH